MKLMKIRVTHTAGAHPENDKWLPVLRIEMDDREPFVISYVDAPRLDTPEEACAWAESHIAPNLGQDLFPGGRGLACYEGGVEL